jgi:tetratricopeptide (TPR) repeat protein
MSQLLPVGSSPFHATSYENSNTNTLTIFALGTVTALAVAVSLAYCRLKAPQARPTPLYFDLGKAAFEAGNFAIALQHFDDALTHRQASAPKIHYEKARAYLEMGEYDASLESCERASKLLRDAPLPIGPAMDSELPAQLLCLQADLHLMQSKKTQVIYECGRVLELKPKNSQLLRQTYLLLALAYSQSNNHLAAQENYARATTNNLETNLAIAVIILYNQALCKYKAGCKDAHCFLEWAERDCQALSFRPSLLRFVLPLPPEWGEKIDPTDANLTPAEQLKRRIQKARAHIFGISIKPNEAK